MPLNIIRVMIIFANGNSFQHNVQLLDDGTLLFFDNGNLSQMLLEAVPQLE